MNRYFTGAALLGVLALTGSGLAVAQPPAKPAMQCFYAHDWGNWTAPDAHTMYIRVGNRRIYRLEFASSCPMMTEPDVHLITHFRGADSVCSGHRSEGIGRHDPGAVHCQQNQPAQRC
jgi:hypothetical protein